MRRLQIEGLWRTGNAARPGQKITATAKLLPHSVPIRALMPQRNRMFTRFAATLPLVLLLAGCATMPNPWGGSTPSPVASAAAPASAVVATPDGVATSKDPRVASLTTAGTKPLTGAAIGSYMDEEESALRASVMSSGVTVTRAGEQIILTLPAPITFDPEKVTLRSEFNATIATIGGILAKHSQTVIDVYGYTDDQAADAHNKALSQRRAVTIAAALAKAGVDQRRFYIEGRGEADPVASNATEVGRAQNRRVEIRISPIT